MFDQKTMDKVWEKARPVRGLDPNEFRQDPYGNRIRKGEYGKVSREGWEIDHIKPESKGGSDHIRNLQALQTTKNRQLGDTSKKRSRHSKR